MQLHIETTNSAARSFLASTGLYCPHCAEPMIAPAASEFVAGHGVRNRWHCESCGCETQTTIEFGRG